MSARHRISKLLLRRGLVFDEPGETWSTRHPAPPPRPRDCRTSRAPQATPRSPRPRGGAHSTRAWTYRPALPLVTDRAIPPLLLLTAYGLVLETQTHDQPDGIADIQRGALH